MLDRAARRERVERAFVPPPDELRPVTIEPGFVRTATGSVLYSQGETRIICTASATESVPRWLEGRGRGWVTAEYAMLPASTGERKERDSKRGNNQVKQEVEVTVDKETVKKKEQKRSTGNW